MPKKSLLVIIMIFVSNISFIKAAIPMSDLLDKKLDVAILTPESLEDVTNEIIQPIAKRNNDVEYIVDYIYDVDNFSCSQFAKSELDILIFYGVANKSEIDTKICNEYWKNIKIITFVLGYDNIVLMSSSSFSIFNVSRADLFKALSKYTYANGVLIDNPYTKWSEVNNSLPNIEISYSIFPGDIKQVEIFIDNFIEPTCVNIGDGTRFNVNSDEYKKYCRTLRDDKSLVKFNTNTPLSIKINEVIKSKNILFISWNSVYKPYERQLSTISINGIRPNMENLKNSTYSKPMPVFMYVSNLKINDRKINLVGIVELLITELSIDGNKKFIDKTGLIPQYSIDTKKNYEKLEELTKQK